MSEVAPDSTRPSRIGCVVALGLILLPGVVAWVAGGPPGEDWPVTLFWGVLLAIPFAYLALEGTRSWLPWVATAALSACFWGALVASVITSARDRTGVNFGMGLVMLASPLIVTVGAWLAVQFTKRR